MSQVKNAGVPGFRQRATAGWQQVIAGPVRVEGEAEASRARLERAGFSGTQIVTTRTDASDRSEPSDHLS